MSELNVICDFNPLCHQPTSQVNGDVDTFWGSLVSHVGHQARREKVTAEVEQWEEGGILHNSAGTAGHPKKKVTWGFCLTHNPQKSALGALNAKAPNKKL